jgi:hypothetical protein
LKNKINIENYEAFLLDWMEGSLNQADIALLKEFLKNHPEIHVDDDFLSQTISSSDSFFNDKHALKKFLTDDVYIAYHEGDLSELEKQEVEEYVAINDTAKKDFELYQKLKLSPPHIVFENKQALKKKGIVFPFKRLAYYTSAAAAMWLLVLWLMPNEQNYQPQPLANYSNTEELEDPSFELKVTHQHAPLTTIKQSSKQENTMVADNSAPEEENSFLELTLNQKQPELIDVEDNSVVFFMRDIDDDNDSFATTENNRHSDKKSSRQFTPKQFLVDVFKRKILKVDDNQTELEAYDFAGVLARISNDKIMLQKKEDGNHLAIHTKYFSFEKKFSQ